MTLPAETLSTLLGGQQAPFAGCASLAASPAESLRPGPRGGGRGGRVQRGHGPAQSRALPGAAARLPPRGRLSAAGRSRRDSARTAAGGQGDRGGDTSPCARRYPRAGQRSGTGPRGAGERG